MYYNVNKVQENIDWCKFYFNIFNYRLNEYIVEFVSNKIHNLLTTAIKYKNRSKE